jgi:very-short-patch-repair endonuclease
MQPFVAAEKVKDAYWRYIETSFPIRRDALRAGFRQLVEEQKLLWQEPFISLSRPFKTGGSFDDLITAGVLDPRITNAHWGFDVIWEHQAAAIRRLSTLATPRNTLIATGTGSGKTEAFLIPIVDDCLRNPEPKGVRAVIIYPMNALANDQLDRLRHLLAGTGVSFGRYTGDTPFDERNAQERGIPRPDTSPPEERYTREEIQNDPPHILLTNYVMLELLLLRKDDQKIFHGVRPRYLVLDEVHTYAGILGAEVACLIRRFKEHNRLRSGELVCVGTSATIVGEDDDGGRNRLVEFAAELFAEPFGSASRSIPVGQDRPFDRSQDGPFDEDAVIEEVYEDIRWPAAKLEPPPELSDEDLLGVNPEDAEDVRRLAQKALGLEVTDEGEALYEIVYQAIEDRRAFAELEALLTTPRSISTVVEAFGQLEGRQGLDRRQIEREVTALLLLGSAAHKPDSGAPPETRFHPKIHLIVRSLAPLSVCLNPECGQLLTDGATECTCEPSGLAARALTLGLCRSCGADYRIGYFAVADDMLRTFRGKKRSKDKLEIDHVGTVILQAEEATAEQLEPLYLYPGALEDLILEEEGELPVRAAEYVVCPICLQARPASAGNAVCENPTCPGEGGGPLPHFVAFLRGSKCPVCQAQGRGRRPEIITPLRSGAAPSVAVLAQSLFPYLEEKNEGRASEKRILIFADSRQDTAHQAGYLRDRHQVFTQRQIVYQTLSRHEEAGAGPIALPDLAREVFLRTRDERGEIMAMNLLTPIEYRDATEAGFFEEGQVISRAQIQRAIARLRWDLAVEFTDRATSRYSLEREGLTTVHYSRLEETAQAALAGFEAYGITDAYFLELLLRSLLDYMRVRQAVNYEPFRDYLDSKSTPVYRGEAKPTRETRAPIGFDTTKRDRSGAYRVYAWYNRDKPGAYQTAIYNMVRRAVPALSNEDVARLIDELVDLLQARGYLRHEEIGRLSASYGRLSTQAYQVVEGYMEVTTQGERYRCPTCGQSRGYLLRGLGTGEPICNSYRCRGKPELYTPDPETNFYVRVYTAAEPERLYPVEHSGQLGPDDRVKIEKKFKAGLVNTLVCTPTLELGVNIGDLVALLMRNVPPTPSNYAQRAGRAGRDRRVALILSHAGLGPHDSYFFQFPEDMISGRIRTPLFLLDNRVVIDRHLNSLILEKLLAELPTRWEGIRSEEGYLQQDVLTPFEEELASRGPDIQTAVAEAFVKERDEGGLSWLTEDYVQKRVEQFIPGLREGLENWCRRYREVYEELRKSRVKVRPTQAEQERERKLSLALFTLENDRRYYPLSYLAQVGFLPRYGFPGATVAIRDDRQREISQAASVGIIEYAPGNIVYVGGRKLRVTRLLFPGGTKDDPTYNAETYKYCPNCDFATDRNLDRACPYCHEPLMTGRFLDYEAAYGGEIDFITQDDEYRDHENYDTVTYLQPRQDEPTPHDRTVLYDRWAFEYSRLRQVEIFNRGRLERGSGRRQPFVVCLECGMWHEPRRDEARRASRDDRVPGHLPSCTVPTWDPDMDPRIERELHLRAAVQGDVIEIPLPAEVVHNAAWIETFAQALKLGMQLEFFVAPHELDSFVRRWEEDGQKHAALVLYDTMPGGTGYLLRLVDNMPQLTARVARHLADCPCERACYRCLKEFWNQRIHHLLDKTLVQTVLETLAAAGPGIVLPPLSHRQRFESFLEAEFYSLLQKEGLPLPKAQEIVRTPDGTYIMRADFTYDHPPTVILTDGQAFHTDHPMTIVEDLDRRNALALSGQRLLEFTYHDVISRPDSVVEAVKAALSVNPGSEKTLREAREAYAAIPAPAQAFAEDLCRRDPRFQKGGRIPLATGERLDTLALDPERGLAVVLIDPSHWMRDSRAWGRDLARHNQARLQGWRLVRVPRPWLGAPQGQELIERLSNM